MLGLVPLLRSPKLSGKPPTGWVGSPSNVDHHGPDTFGSQLFGVASEYNPYL